MVTRPTAELYPAAVRRHRRSEFPMRHNAAAEQRQIVCLRNLLSALSVRSLAVCVTSSIQRRSTSRWACLAVAFAGSLPRWP